MPYQDLLGIAKPFFSKEEAAHALDISPRSAAVVCSRYVKKGLLTRLKRNLYVRTETLKTLAQEDLFRIANFLQVPSYISLTTALFHHGITTQLQRNVFESVSVQRSKTYVRGGLTFRYVKIDRKLYTGFDRDKGVFIASAEKAVLDCFYLTSMGRYPVDLSSLDLAKLDDKLVTKLLTIYPLRAVKFFERQYEKIRRA
jgi:predicted transcriptional regulator of viral defense system